MSHQDTDGNWQPSATLCWNGPLYSDLDLSPHPTCKCDYSREGPVGVQERIKSCHRFSWGVAEEEHEHECDRSLGGDGI